MFSIIKPYQSMCPSHEVPFHRRYLSPRIRLSNSSLLQTIIILVFRHTVPPFRRLIIMLNPQNVRAAKILWIDRYEFVSLISPTEQNHAEQLQSNAVKNMVTTVLKCTVLPFRESLVRSQDVDKFVLYIEDAMLNVFRFSEAPVSFYSTLKYIHSVPTENIVEHHSPT